MSAARIDETLRQFVRTRAHARCEYCGLPDEFADAPFQVDHIIAEKHNGQTHPDNLAWSCFYCNSYKGPNIAGWDSDRRTVVRLFHPRDDQWDEHFRWDGPFLEAMTDIARATIHVLCMNAADAVEARRLLIELGIALR